MKDIPEEMTIMLALAGMAAHGLLSGGLVTDLSRVAPESFAIADQMMAEMDKRVAAVKTKVKP